MPAISRTVLRLGLVLLLAVAPFLPALGNALVWDDHFLAGPEAPRASIASAFTRPFVLAGKVTPYYRPAVSLSLLADQALWGGRPQGYHATNIVLHAAASLCVFLIAGSLLSATPALVAAGIFAVHPVPVEAVAFVSGRSDLLAGLFLLAALAALLRAPDGSPPRPRHDAGLLAAAAAFLVSLLAKESVLLSPLIIAYALFVVSRRRGTPAASLIARGAPFALAFALYGGLRWLALADGPGLAGRLDAIPDASLVPPVLLGALRLLLFPRTLSPYHELQAYSPAALLAVVAALLALGGLLLALGRRLRWSPAFTLGVLLLVVPLVPALPLFPREGSPLAERFLYLPVAGLALLAGALLEHLAPPRLPARATAVGAALLLVVAGAWTAVRVGDWRDDLTLFSRAAARDPGNAVLTGLYGEALLVSGDHARAEPVLLTATRLDPSLASPWLRLADLYRVTGREDLARSTYAFVLGRDPNNVQGHYRLGLLELGRGDLSAAGRAFRETVRLNPYFVDAYVNLGGIAYESGRRDEAVAYWRRALALDPKHPLALGNLEAAGGAGPAARP